jgi:polysaccharide export outer membrane protein
MLFIQLGSYGGPDMHVLAQQPLQEYTLNPGDVVEISVFGEPDLSRSVTIGPNGKINLPLIGDIQAAGLTPAQLNESVTRAYKAYVRNPQVTVSVREYQRAYVYLVGQVARTGSVEIQRGWTVLEVMSVAGGITPRAAPRRATLIRRATGEVIALDLDRLLNKGDRTVNPRVEPGDIIMVPALQNRVMVLGAVARPGAYDVDEGARIFETLALAGSPLERSATNNIGLIRPGPDGKPIVKTVDMTKFVKGDFAQNVPVADGDIIYVPPDNRIRWADVLGYLGGLSLIRTFFGSP